jgi:hypothetical protein
MFYDGDNLFETGGSNDVDARINQAKSLMGLYELIVPKDNMLAPD